MSPNIMKKNQSLQTIFRLFLAVSIGMAVGGSISMAGQKNHPAKLKSAESEIRAVLDAQVAAWNAGNLEDFMKGYWRSPELTFFSGGRKLSGWDATLDRYRKTYQADGKEMGKLEFSDLDIRTLGEGGAVVRGRWKLQMSDGKELGGLYTLILRRFKDGWKIVHDHTSS
jgi:beta-aspartyl-peptidase (threonine type)